MPTTRNLALLVFGDVEVLDFCGPFEVFTVANRFTDPPAFHVFTLAEKPARSSSSRGNPWARSAVGQDGTVKTCNPIKDYHDDLCRRLGLTGTFKLLRKSSATKLRGPTPGSLTCAPTSSATPPGPCPIRLRPARPGPLP
jgi:hypothetical protein